MTETEEQEWRERLKAAGEQTLELRRRKAAIRAEMAVRRAYGKASYHAAKLARNHKENRTMTDTDTTRTCQHCQGTGTFDPTQTIDENNIEALRKELAYSIASSSNYGLDSEQRGRRIRMASRIVWLANRLIWLETCQLIKEEDDARYAAMRHANPAAAPGIRNE